MATKIWINIGLGNDLFPDCTKPLPEPMLTGHQWSPVTSILGKFHERCLNHQSLNLAWNYMSKISFKFARGQWVNQLTHFGLLTSLWQRDLGQHCFWLWLEARLYQAITWANVDPYICAICRQQTFSTVTCVCDWSHHWLRCLFSAKPSPHPMIIHCQLDHSELLWNYNKTIKVYIKVKKKSLWDYEGDVTLVAIIGTTMPQPFHLVKPLHLKSSYPYISSKGTHSSKEL